MTTDAVTIKATLMAMPMSIGSPVEPKKVRKDPPVTAATTSAADRVWIRQNMQLSIEIIRKKATCARAKPSP